MELKGSFQPKPFDDDEKTPLKRPSLPLTLGPVRQGNKTTVKAGRLEGGRS